MPTKFVERLQMIQQQQGSWVCVGIDPDPEKLPFNIPATPEGFLNFSRQIVEATAPFVCIFKPNQGFWAAIGAEEELAQLIHYIQEKYGLLVILDAKRNDIGNSAKMYAMEAFGRYGADAVTVNPYLGTDGVVPFTEHVYRGVFILCRTSNKSAVEFQGQKVMLPDAPSPLYLKVAGEAVKWNQGFDNVGLVVGATYPGELQEVRSIVGPAMPILIPGIGKQGGDLEKTLAANGRGLAVVNSSREIIYASREEDFAAAAARKAQELRDQINQLAL